VADGKESASARYLAADGLVAYHVRCRCNYGFSFNRLIVFIVIRKLSKVPICIALNEQLTYKALGYGTCQRGITEFYLPPTRLSTSGMNRIPAFTPQPQIVTVLWSVLIFRPADGRRLSWPEWLVTNRGGLPIGSRSPIPLLTGPGV